MPSHKELQDDPFGTGQGWPEVVSYIGLLLRSKVPSLRSNPGELEEVLGEVQLDLLDYWATIPSSTKSNGYYNWGGAVRRGVWFGARVAWEGLPSQRGGQSVSVNQTVVDTYSDDEDERVVLARKVLESFSSEELHEFFEGILGDTSSREAERLYGVGYKTVQRRRAAQRERLKDRARAMGLLDA